MRITAFSSVFVVDSPEEPLSQLSQTGDNHWIRPGMLIVCQNTAQKMDYERAKKPYSCWFWRIKHSIWMAVSYVSWWYYSLMILMQGNASGSMQQRQGRKTDTKVASFLNHSPSPLAWATLEFVFRCRAQQIKSPASIILARFTPCENKEMQLQHDTF